MSIENIPNTTIIRIGKAIAYIEAHLDQKLVLEEVAQHAHYSPYHFHRLFAIVTGETVQNFIARKRIEKAAGYLLHQKELQVTTIATKVGFNSLSSLSRAFKKFYGMSPAEFKESSPNKFSKICKTESKNGQIETSFEQYICNITNALNWIKMNAQTEVKQLPKMELAYISHKGGMDLIGNAYQQLMRWGGPKGLLNNPDLKMITIYHDSPKITDPNHVRMSACMTINTPVTTDGEVNLRTLPELKCIVSRFEITPMEFQQAWETSFVWMSEKGYKKAAEDPFEIFHNNPQEHPEGKCIVDICIPVQ